MRSMGHPDYVYRPISDERRRKLSLAQKGRLGIPDGFHRVRGTLVPDEHFHRISSWANAVCRYLGQEEAEIFVADAEKAEWQIEKPKYSTWGLRDWALYRDLIAEGMTREEVAGYAGVVEWYLNKGVLEHRKGRRV